MKHTVFPWVSLALFFAILTLSLSSLASASPSDIEGHVYEDAISLLTEEGIISGYPDGTYQPEREVNRVEFLKIVVGSVFDDIDLEATDDTCGFNDTVSGEWYIPYLCRAVEEGIVQGYDDGTFKPEQAVNFVEASKIASLAHGQDLSEDGSVWYAEYITFVSNNLLIPPDIEEFGANLTRGQVAELLGRYFLLDQNELASYLADHAFDYVFYDVDENVLSQTTQSLVDIDDYLSDDGGDADSDGYTWLTYAALLENPVETSGDDWTFSADTADNMGITTVFDYYDSDGLSLDIVTDEGDTTFDVSNSKDYALDFAGTLGEVYTTESYLELDDYSDFTGIMSYLDDSVQYDWSEDRVSGDPNFDDNFIWTDLESGSSYERSISDGVPTESFLLTTSEAWDDDDDQTVFSNDFQYGEDSGAVQNWLWQSSDGEVIVNQVMKDDYYTEFLGYSPSDEAQMTLEYDQENVTESFDFVSEDGAYVLNMDMTNDDFDEYVTYESDELDVDMTMTDMNVVDGTVFLSDDGGETVEMTFTDNALSAFTTTVQDGDNTVSVYYYDYGEYAYLSGLLTSEEGSYYLFSDEGLYEHGTSVSSDEISINSSAVILASDLIDLTFEGDELQVDFEQAGSNETASGNLLFQGLLSDFNLDLNLGDKEAYDEGLQSGSSFKWYKGFELGLDPNRLIQGRQNGGIKGKDIDKTWQLEFDPESAGLNQNLDIEKEGFKKELNAKTSLFDYWLRQQMKLKGEFKGIDVDLDSTTTVENGEVTGEANIKASTESVDAEFNLDYGSGRDIELNGNILISPLGSPWRFGTGFSSDGKDLTVKPEFSIPLKEGDGLDIDATFGGEFDTNGKSQGKFGVTVHDAERGFDLEADVTVGEGGEIGGNIGVRLGF